MNFEKMVVRAVAASVVMMSVLSVWAEDEVMLFPIVKDAKWGYMDNTGKVVIEPKYDGAWDFHEGLACVGEGLLRGYIDRTGTMVIKPWFAYGSKFSSGKALVYGHANGKKYGIKYNDFWGDDIQFYRTTGWYMYIDKKGKAAKAPMRAFWIPPDFSEGKVCNRKVCIGLDLKAIKHDADDLGTFSDGLVAARKIGRWGYLDHDMKWAIEPKFNFVGNFKEGLAPVAKADAPVFKDNRAYLGWEKKLKKNRYDMLKWGYIDKSGKLVIDYQFEDAWVFSDGLAPVRVAGKWGYVNVSGKVVIEAEYDYAWQFSEGLGRVLVGEKHGFVDKTGKLVIKPQYDIAWEFSKGLARVGLEEKEGYINSKGVYVREPTQ